MHQNITATVELGENERPLAEDLQATLQVLEGFAQRPAEFDPSWVDQTTKVVKGCLQVIELVEKQIAAHCNPRRCPTYTWARRIQKRRVR